MEIGSLSANPGLNHCRPWKEILPFKRSWYIRICIKSCSRSWSTNNFFVCFTQQGASRLRGCYWVMVEISLWLHTQAAAKAREGEALLQTVVLLSSGNEGKKFPVRCLWDMYAQIFLPNGWHKRRGPDFSMWLTHCWGWPWLLPNPFWSLLLCRLLLPYLTASGLSFTVLQQEWSFIKNLTMPFLYLEHSMVSYSLKK